MASGAHGASLDFYAGSFLLEPLANAIGLPIDQVNFVSCQLAALGFGCIFRKYLPPGPENTIKRHVVEIILGILLTVFCFGHQICHLMLQSAVCLLFMKWLPMGMMEKVAFVTALSFLCFCHIYRQLLDYGGYTLDITGPLMINTQRLSSLAFSLRDGAIKDESKLTEGMRQKAVRRFPSWLEYFSYVFSFHGVICGPMTFYGDYISFIDGTNVLAYSAKQTGGGAQNKEITYPSPAKIVAKKLLVVLSCLVVTIVVIPMFPLTYLLDEEVKNKCILSKMVYIIIGTTLTRQKYYFAWTLGDLVHNSAGLGFSGYDANGETEWKLLENANIWHVETSLSLKVLLDNWNKTTTYWLRHVVYERVKIARTLAVFTCSAFWHGFYPGYYITFLTGALCIEAGRVIRRKVRPLFQGSSQMTFLYDVITFIGTRLSIAYITFCFVLLEFWPSLHIYKQLYFWLHICAVVIVGYAMLFLDKKKQH